MPLSNAPGEWRWEQRGNKNWWHINDKLNIEDGPHPAVDVEKDLPAAKE